MSIEPSDCINQTGIYTDNKIGLWKIVAYCEEPTVTMENLFTGKRETFGVSSLTAQRFRLVGSLPRDWYKDAREYCENHPPVLKQ